MNKKDKEFWSQIFTRHDWDGDMDCTTFYGVKFVKNFGPWKKGYTAEIIEVNYSNSSIVEYDNNNEVVAQCFVTPTVWER